MPPSIVDARYLQQAVACGFIDRDRARQVEQALTGACIDDVRAFLFERGMLTEQQDCAVRAALEASADRPLDDTMVKLTFTPAGRTQPATVRGGLPTIAVDADIDDRTLLVVQGSGPRAGHAPAASHAAPAPSTGMRSAKFTRVREIGKGGMGRVDLGNDAEIGRQVAIKTLLHDDPRAVQRFIEEGQVTGQLEHPNIVPVYELDRDATHRPFLVMKCVQGQTLADVLTAARRGKLETLIDGDERGARAERALTRLLEMFAKVCDAMSFAHARGVLHRDLKPDNIMIGRFGEVLVMDWGLAKVVGHDAGNNEADAELINTVRTLRTQAAQPLALETQEGALAGTPMYMAPEQAEGRIAELDIRSDVYALGVVLYEIISLNTPYTAPNVYSLLGQVARGKYAPLRQRSRAPWPIPRELQAITLKAMALQPADRYQTVGALKADIEAYQSDASVTACSDDPLQSLVKWSKRHPAAALSSATAALLLMLLGLVAAVLLAQAAEADRATAEANRIAAGERAGREQAERDRIIETQARREAELAKLAREHRIDDLLVELGAMRRNDFDEALTEFRRRWDSHRNEFGSDEAFVASLGDHVARYLDAFDLLFTFARENPDLMAVQADDYFHRGMLRYRSGNSAGALDDYGNAIRMGDPGTAAPAHNNRGLIYRNQGDLEAAIADYGAAIRHAPRWVPPYVNRGIARHDAGDPNGALEDLDEALRLDRSNATALNNRGIVRRTLGDLEGAVLDWSDAIRFAPKSAGAYCNRGSALHELNDADGALQDLNDAIAIAPDYAEAYNSRGTVHRDGGNLIAAIENYSTAIRLRPDYANALKNRGIAYADHRNYRAALADLNDAVRLLPEDADAICARASARAGLNDLDGAIADFTNAIGLDPTLVRAYNNRGNARYANGDMHGAINDYTEAIRLDSAHVKAYSNRGAAHLSLHNLEAAIGDLTAALALAPTFWPAWKNLGIAQADAGRGDEARRCFDQALKYAPPETHAEIRELRRQAMDE